MSTTGPRAGRLVVERCNMDLDSLVGLTENAAHRWVKAAGCTAYSVPATGIIDAAHMHRRVWLVINDGKVVKALHG